MPLAHTLCIRLQLRTREGLQPLCLTDSARPGDAGRWDISCVCEIMHSFIVRQLDLSHPAAGFARRWGRLLGLDEACLQSLLLKRRSMCFIEEDFTLLMRCVLHFGPAGVPWG